MPAPRRKRLPTDFFDKLLSNQTDDQMNDLLSSLVEEQIAPTPDAVLDELPRLSIPVMPGKKRTKEFHHEKIEDSIVTRDESLEDLSGLSGDSGIDIIPRTARMNAAGVVIPPTVEPKSKSETIVKPPVMPAVPGAVPEPEKRKSRGMSDLVEKAGAALPGADFVVPEELIRDVSGEYIAEVPQPEVPTADLTSSAETITEETVPAVPVPPLPVKPVSQVVQELPEPVEPLTSAPVFEEPEPVRPIEVPAPVKPRELTHEELRKARRSVRWEQPPLRKPKMPKMAVPTQPITFKPPDETLDFVIPTDALFKGKVRRVSRAALFFLLPAFIGFSLFSWYPMIKGFIISLFNYAPIGTSTFVGFANYARAFHDEMFWRTLMHAGGFCLMALGLGFWLPIVLSILLNEIRWGKGLLKFLFFLPFLMPSVPAAILWKWILDQGFGLLNAVAALLGVAHPHIGWLTTPNLALLSIVVLYIWKNTGWAILIYSAALANIDETLYEEAELDGASVWGKIWHITMPSLRAVTGVMLIITIINTIQIFTEVFILTNGGPMNATEVIATYIYKQAFFYMDIGYAAALSFMMLVMLLIITVFRLRRLAPEGE
jgi:multiple sugar transport system permease protein